MSVYGRPQQSIRNNTESFLTYNYELIHYNENQYNRKEMRDFPIIEALIFQMWI